MSKLVFGTVRNTNEKRTQNEHTKESMSKPYESTLGAKVMRVQTHTMTIYTHRGQDKYKNAPKRPQNATPEG